MSIPDPMSVRRIGHHPSGTRGWIQGRQGPVTPHDVAAHPGSLGVRRRRRDRTRITIRPDDRGRRAVSDFRFERFAGLPVDVGIQAGPMLKRESAAKPGRNPSRQQRRLDWNGTGAAHWIDQRHRSIPSRGKQATGSQRFPKRCFGDIESVASTVQQGTRRVSADHPVVAVDPDNEPLNRPVIGVRRSFVLIGVAAGRDHLDTRVE